MWKKVCDEADKHNKYGFQMRAIQIANMKQEVSIDPSKLAVSVFRLQLMSSKLTESVLFAFVYSELSSDGSIKPKYFCANPSFESRDGEYRPKIGRYDNLDSMSSTYPDLLNDVDTYITSKKMNMGWSVETDHFYNFESAGAQKKYERTITTLQLSNRLLMVIWFSSIYNIYYGMIEVHTNEKFNRVLGFTGTSLAKDTKFFHSLEEQYGSTKLRHLRQLQDYFYTDPQLEKSFRLGQKIIPLSLIEVERIYSVGYKPWRELLISTHLGDLVVNRICPMFAINVGFFYIERGESNLFDNAAQVVRTEMSKAATGIAHMLHNARSMAHNADAKSTIEEESLRSWSHDKFAALNEIMDEAIVFNKKEMILSHAALCIFSEFMGKTLHNAIESAMRSEVYDQYLGGFLTDQRIFAKFVFEYMYGLLCANYHGGVIHTDVHLNNLCVRPIYSTAQRPIRSELKSPHVVYDLGASEGDGPFYALPSTQYYGSIIDFSRGIIKISNLSAYTNADLDYASSEGLSHFAGISDVSSLMVYSICRARNMYKQYLPEFYEEHTVLIEIVMREHFPSIFHLLTAFDPLMFCIKLRDFIGRVENKEKFGKTLRPNTELLEMIISKCKHILTHDILHLALTLEKTHTHPINKVQIHSYKPEPSTSTIVFMHKPQVEFVEWKEPSHAIQITDYPIHQMLISCFNQFTLSIQSSLDDKDIFDQYAIGRKSSYSLDSYESLPPAFKNAAMKRHYAASAKCQQTSLRRMDEVAIEHLQMF